MCPAHKAFDSINLMLILTFFLLGTMLELFGHSFVVRYEAMYSIQFTFNFIRFTVEETIISLTGQWDSANKFNWHFRIKEWTQHSDDISSVWKSSKLRCTVVVASPSILTIFSFAENEKYLSAMILAPLLTEPPTNITFLSQLFAFLAEYTEPSVSTSMV